MPRAEAKAQLLKEIENEKLDYCQVPGCLNKNIRKVAYCHLHLAAPALLEAVDDLVKTFDDGSWNKPVQEKLNRAKAALKSARGD